MIRRGGQLSDGEVKKFKKHPRVDIDLGPPGLVETVQLNRRPSNEKNKHLGALPAPSKPKHLSASTKTAKSGGGPGVAALPGAATGAEESTAKSEIRQEKS